MGRKLVEKMIHQKKNRGHRTSKIAKSAKAVEMAISPIICSFYYLARALMHDAVCEFACAVGCAETISANVLKYEVVVVFTAAAKASRLACENFPISFFKP